ncbi:hypothetical protein EBU99_11845 [bacterium]|nr:hypothetical protein [bacterium]
MSAIAFAELVFDTPARQPVRVAALLLGAPAAAQFLGVGHQRLIFARALQSHLKKMICTACLPTTAGKKFIHWCQMPLSNWVNCVSSRNHSNGLPLMKN